MKYSAKMKRILFIDRDGTLVQEPEDCRVDSFEKVQFLPRVLGSLSRIAREFDYDLVMVSNQDGLGTPLLPEEKFRPVHEFILRILESEGIRFREIVIDRTLPGEQAPTRKPQTGLLTHYFSPEFDLAHSFVIGDRITDIKLARNLGARAIWINNGRNLGNSEIREGPEDLESTIALVTHDWPQIYEFLRTRHRELTHERRTRETDIRIRLNLDGKGSANIRTGLGFFDHMLEQVARHGNLDLDLEAQGDLHIDEHHTVEDTGIALGEAFARALGDKKGLERYGFCLPMDESLARVALDFGGRSFLVWEAEFHRERVGDMPTELFRHFFKSFCDGARCNLNIRVEGDNEHHKIEAVFKAFARSIRMAVRQDPDHPELPSTKGIL